MSATFLRGEVLRVLHNCGPRTADEVANILDRSVLAIRPRVSELHHSGHVHPTGQFHRNASGTRARVWGLG